MTQLRLSLLALITLFSSVFSQTFGQVATATWALTANNSSAVTGNVTASVYTFGAGLGTTSYNGTNGATAALFNGTYCTPNTTDYFEFTVSPSGCNNLTVTSVTFDHRTSSTAANRCFQLKYSVNGGAEVQQGVNILVASTTPTAWTSGTISISVPAGGNIRFRLYGAGTGTGTTSLSARNFVVNGTTAAVGTVTPSVSIAVSPGNSICSGTSVTFTATPVNGGLAPTYQWNLNGGNVGGGTSVYTNAALANGDQVYVVMTSNNPCASPINATSNIITMAVTPAPTVTLGANPSICLGITSANLTYSATTGSPNQYSINYNAAAEAQGFVDVTNAILPASPIVLIVPSGAVAGTYNYDVTVRNSTTGCTSIIYAKTIILAAPTITLGANPTVCRGTLTANQTYTGTTGTPNQYSIDYDVAAEAQGFVDVTNAVLPASPIVLTVPAAPNSGTYNYTLYVRNSTSGCSSIGYAKTVTVNPGITFGTSPSVCSGTTSANLPYTATSGTPNQYSIVYSGAAIAQGFVNVTNAVLPVSPIVLVVPAGAVAGTYTYTVTVRNTGVGCTNISSSPYSQTITVSPLPSTANAGLDQVVCANSTTLAGNNPSFGTGAWSVVTGSATFTNPSLYNSVVTGLGLGANTLRWTISSPGCTASTDNVIITNNLPTTPNAGPDQNICSNTATLAGNTISIGSGTWSVFIGTATITTPGSPTSGVTAIDMGANTLRWTATNAGCTLFDNMVITRLTTPATPGAITGISSVSAYIPGLVYSIAAVSYATTYNWSVPVGWVITSGAGTNSITVTSGNVGQNGNISVTAGNFCGTSPASTLAVTVIVIPTHNNCNQCHINHNSYGTALAIVNGNANLCISCHNPAGTGSFKPFNNAMKAIPGVSGTSHSWDVGSVNVKYGANLPTDAEMLLRMDGGNILCSTCHNQHSNTYSPYLRISNAADALCKNCHSVRNVGRYIDNPAVNYGSHPVGLNYNGSDPRFVSTPASPMQLISSKVECSSCHKVHDAGSSDGYALRMTYSDDLCKKCHVWKAPRRSLDHESMSCISCHITHKAGSVNIMLIRDTINTPNSGLQRVVFTSNTVANDYADGGSPFNGICEACHTITDHYTNTTGGTGDARHLPATQTCVSCHPHENAFYAQSNCFDCHNAVADKPGVGPPGGVRQIVDANGNGTGVGGDFKRSSHHVSGSIPSVDDCLLCHYMGDHKNGEVKLMDPDSGYLKVITYDPANKVTLESFCLNCHDANGAGGDMTPFSDNVTVPYVNKTRWDASSHKNKPFTCANCHDNGHGSNKRNLLAPYTKTADANPDPMDDEEDMCFKNCHSTGGSATANSEGEFSVTGHKHQVDEVAQFGTNSGLECVSCHNPHQNTSAYPNSDPDNTANLWTQSTNGVRDFCLKCHDGAPPSGITFPSTYYGTGWNKSNFINSRHDAVINPGESNFVGSRGDCLACHDHHSTASTDAATSYIGQYTMIKWRFDKSGVAGSSACNTYAAADYDLCFRCHRANDIMNSTNAFSTRHNYHVTGQQTACIICHDVHSPYDAGESGLINYLYGVSALTGNNVGLGSRTHTTVFTPGNCYMSCHDSWTCGGTVHSDNYTRSPLTYPWTYTWPF